MKKSILKIGAASLFLLGLCMTQSTHAQTVTTIAGDPGTEGFNSGTVTWEDARFNLPFGVGLDGNNNIFITDTWSHNIRILHSSKSAYFRGGKPGDPNVNGAGDVDQNGIQSKFWIPSGIAFDADNNMYVADEFNNKIRKLSKFVSLGQVSVVSTEVGRGSGNAGSDDGSKAVATLNGPKDIAVASNGDLYICDKSNDMIRVWNGTTLTTIAGSTSGYQDGPGGTAQFLSPRSVEFDNNGDLLVADFGNSCVRKVNIASTPQYEVTTVAGDPSRVGVVDGDGLTVARFRGPSGLAVDTDGNIFVTDAFNGNVIRKISPSAQVTTIAGENQSPTLHQDGQGADARFSNPAGIAFNTAKNTLYVADQGNYVIRKIELAAIADFDASKTSLNEGEKISLNSLSLNDPDTYQWTITPSTGVAFSDGTSPTSPSPSVIFNNSGTYTVELDVTNSYGNGSKTRTDYITVGGNTGIGDVYSSNQIKVYPNPNEGQFNVQILGRIDVNGYVVYDLTGREIASAKSNSKNVKNLEVDLTGFQKGFYIVNVLTDKNTISKKILVH